MAKLLFKDTGHIGLELGILLVARDDGAVGAEEDYAGIPEMP